MNLCSSLIEQTHDPGPGEVSHISYADRQIHVRAKPRNVGRSLRDDRDILTIHTSTDKSSSWQKFDKKIEVSGYRHSVTYDFLSLHAALYVAGNGSPLSPISSMRLLDD